jgi:hypothetical protein
VRPRGHFLRATQLERDFSDPEALAGYVLTETAASHLRRIASGLRPESRDRAFRIVGDYGSGKSSLALVLARWLTNGTQGLPAFCQAQFAKEGLELPCAASMVPLLVTGRRQALAVGIQRAVVDALVGVFSAAVPKPVLKLAHQAAITDDEALRLLLLFREYAMGQLGATGVLVVIDEAGKFLEYAAEHPTENDVFLWQVLSDEAARSGSRPLVVVGVLHQGFSAYAHRLGMLQELEWEKVAGRCTELNLRDSLPQTARIVAAALNIDTAALDPSAARQMAERMSLALQHRWFGPVANPASLTEIAPALFPLDPFAFPVLMRLLRRFGQNERSVFSFLFGGEPGGLMAHLQKTSEPFALDDLFDYVLANFDQVLTGGADANRWLMIKALISAASGADPLVDRVLKVVGVLNLMNADDLLATRETIGLALGARRPAREVAACITRLRSEEGKRVLYDRGAAGGLCLWSHVSVDLQSAFETASQRVPPSGNCVGFIKDYLGARSMIARAHYIRTGSLRYFRVRYCSYAEFEQESTSPPPADTNGVLYVPLCETVRDVEKARTIAVAFADAGHCVVALPHRPMTSVGPFIREVLVWDHVLTNTPALNNDPYAQETVSLSRETARRALAEALDRMLGLDGTSSSAGATLIWRGEQQHDIRPGRGFRAFLSHVFNKVYDQAPVVRNELLNRDELSSAGAAARMRLIEGALEQGGDRLFGMDDTKRPPEMSMYLSFFEYGHVHVAEEGTSGWQLQVPDATDDPLNLRPSLFAIRQLLEERLDARVPVSVALQRLRDAPYGVKSGLAELVLAVFAVAEQRQVAFYEDGRFLSGLEGADFLRLTKHPETFEVQLCRVGGVRSDVYSRLAGLLTVEVRRGQEDILDVVRPLCVFAAQLPPHVSKTRRLSDVAQRVRDSLLNAREPAKLLFDDLPKACGLSAIGVDNVSPESVDDYLLRLHGALNELRACYYDLRQRILSALQRNLATQGDGAWRSSVAKRAGLLFPSVSEPRLKSFCFRLSDEALGPDEWAESVGALLASKPPREWGDLDESGFQHELGQLTAQLRRTESALFGETGQVRPDAVRLCLTQATGGERMRVVSVSGTSEGDLGRIRQQFEAIIEREGPRSLAALAQALWERLDG